jgi:hypothetical protein
MSRTATAAGLAAMGARVGITGRDPARAWAAAAGQQEQRHPRRIGGGADDDVAGLEIGEVGQVRGHPGAAVGHAGRDAEAL